VQEVGGSPLSKRKKSGQGTTRQWKKKASGANPSLPREEVGLENTNGGVGLKIERQIHHKAKAGLQKSEKHQV